MESGVASYTKVNQGEPVLPAQFAAHKIYAVFLDTGKIDSSAFPYTAYFNKLDAMTSAKAMKGVVVALPIIADFRPRDTDHS